VVGGMGSLPGAIIAGLLMGEIVSMTTFFAPKLAELVIFLVMAAVLLVRPSGLFGEAGLAE
jgi:branched-chain amino acid transport system permease protein